MADTTFTTGTVIPVDWLNDVNDVVYGTSASILASNVTSTTTGTIVATNVQAAIAELEANKQPKDADLTAIAALTTATYGRSLLETSSEATFKALVNLESGVDVQAYSANIPTAAPGTAGNVLTSTGSAWISSTPIASIVAYINFNGTGTPTERIKSTNVASITDNGTGDYTINFSPALTDANYLVSIEASAPYGVRGGAQVAINSNSSWAEVAPTSSAFRFVCVDASGAAFDPKYVSVTVYR